jgi:hypothetical protein
VALAAGNSGNFLESALKSFSRQKQRSMTLRPLYARLLKRWRAILLDARDPSQIDKVLEKNPFNIFLKLTAEAASDVHTCRKTCR